MPSNPRIESVRRSRSTISKSLIKLAKIVGRWKEKRRSEEGKRKQRKDKKRIDIDIISLHRRTCLTILLVEVKRELPG